MYRKYINIVEAANKGCPIATYDIDVNLKNHHPAVAVINFKIATVVSDQASTGSIHVYVEC